MLDLITWLLAIEVMGLVAFPLSFALFRRLPDRGYALTKPLAMLLTAYLLWALGLTRVIPNSQATVIVLLIIGGLIFAWLYYRRWPELEGFVKAQWRVIVAAEALFLALFLVWCGLLSEFPAINHTEKPMDFAFLNSILQSQFFPPEDPWLSGHPISYYYFGHLIMSAPMQLTGIPSNIGYNLALATVPALTGIAAFGLVYNLARLAGGRAKAAIFFGMTAPILITVVGNLEGGLEFIHLRGWGGEGFWQWVGIKGLEGVETSGDSFFPDSGWWWWRATRVIDTLQDGQSLDYTITEFPFFSFILGDLHAHMMALPFLLLFLSIGLNWHISPEPMRLKDLLRNPGQVGAVALSLGALAFINSWDFPVYTAIFGGLLAIKSYQGRLISPSQAGELAVDNRKKALIGALGEAGLVLVLITLTAILLFLPFYFTLNTQVSGVLPNLGPGTRPLHFFLVMGLPTLLGLGFLLRQLWGLPRVSPADGGAIKLLLSIALGMLLLWVGLALTWWALTQGIVETAAQVASRVLITLPLLLAATLAAFCALQRAGRNQEPLLSFPLLLIAVAAFLLAGAELFHLADFFGNRMNTVFKVYYQAWLLLGVAGSFGIYYCYARWNLIPKWGRVSYSIGGGAAVFLLLIALYYPAGAVLERTALLQERHTIKDNTLDGLDYLRHSAASEHAAIEWLRDEAPAGRIIEAVGDDYTEYNRVSAATGRPTLLGWKGHELQWRGSDRSFSGREAAAAEIYQSKDSERVRQLLSDYGIRYVYLGSRERAKYDIKELSGGEGFLKIVFSHGDVIIYETGAGLPSDE